jgi:gamma-glutamyltranspeptidase/glutathione hydrolase
MVAIRADRRTLGLRIWALRAGRLGFAGVFLASSCLSASAATNMGGIGVVVADEPNAAIAARNMLEAGGSVADAATTLYFTLSVTYPVAASLGGGGVCLHYDPETRKAESIDFLPRAARGGGSIAVPGAIRGFSYLQGQYGRKRWNEVVAPAARLAANGFMLSRALADQLKAHGAAVKQSPLLARLFLDEDGAPKSEGDAVSELALGSTLALVGGRGPAGFYSGPLAGDIIQTANSAGGALSHGDLYDYRADTAAAPVLELKKSQVLTASAKTGSGALAAAVVPALAAMAEQTEPGAIANGARAAVRTALQSFNVGALPGDFGSTGFVVADKGGELVACGLTLSQPFGTGQEVARAGFALAPAPKGAAGLAGAFLTPLIVTGAKGRDVLYAGMGAGGPDSASANFALALASLAHDQALLQPTWEAAEKDSAGSVNLIACTKGLMSDARSCVAAADPHGHGVAIQGEGQSRGGGFLGLGLF